MRVAQRAKRFSEQHLTAPRAEHAYRVAQLVHGSGDEVIAAAYLHDILEDTKITERKLRKSFGARITMMVVKLTNPTFIHQPTGRDFSHLKDATPEVKKIKLADRIDNIKKRVYGEHIPSFHYANETERLLEIIKEGDTGLAGILKNLIIKLKIVAARYRHEKLPEICRNNSYSTTI